MQIIYGEIQGIKRVEYTNKHGQQRSGYEYHFTYETEDIQGFGCASIYVSDLDLKRAPATPGVGDQLTVAYDPFRRSMSFLPI